MKESKQNNSYILCIVGLVLGIISHIFVVFGWLAIIGVICDIICLVIQHDTQKDLYALSISCLIINMIFILMWLSCVI